MDPGGKEDTRNAFWIYTANTESCNWDKITFFKDHVLPRVISIKLQKLENRNYKDKLSSQKKYDMCLLLHLMSGKFFS